MDKTEQTRKIAQMWFDRLTGGKIEEAIELLDPEVEWINYKIIPDYNDEMPWIGTVHGPQAVFDSFKRFISVATPQKEQLERLICDGEEAMGVVHEISLINETQQLFEIQFIQELQVRNGKIVRWKSYTDPSSIERAIEWHVNEGILQAVIESDARKVLAHLKKRADPNHRDPETGLNLLMIAAGQGDADIVKLLLEHGGDLFTVDAKGGASPLHKAIQGGSLECVKLLVEAGAFIDWQACTTGHTPLMDAFWFKHPEIVGYLLEHHAGLNLGTHYGFTFRQHVEFERDVNVKGKGRIEQAIGMVEARDTSDKARVESQKLMSAVNGNDIEGVKTLLAGGADVDERYPFLNSFNDDHTPLLVACRDGHTEIVRLLLDAGADVNAVEPTFGAVPLHKATYNGHDEIVAVLVKCPVIDLNFQGVTNGYTPLHDALWHGYDRCAKRLVDAGARLDLLGHDGKLPLDIAIDSFGRDHTIVQLIRDKSGS